MCSDGVDTKVDGDEQIGGIGESEPASSDDQQRNEGEHKKVFKEPGGTIGRSDRQSDPEEARKRSGARKENGGARLSLAGDQ